MNLYKINDLSTFMKEINKLRFMTNNVGGLTVIETTNNVNIDYLGDRILSNDFVEDLNKAIDEVKEKHINICKEKLKEELNKQ